MQEMGKFYVKVNVTPNGLEKSMASTIKKNLVFIKNSTDNDFEQVSQEFSGDLLELFKQKGVHPYEYMDSFKTFSEDKLPDRCEFFSSSKNKCISEKNDSHTLDI